MTARFAPGDGVRVEQRETSGHTRAPGYIRGKSGMVERICGAFGNPEALAYGRSAAEVPLYRVRFPQRAVWRDYGGSPCDTIDVELYEHWLEPAGDPG